MKHLKKFEDTTEETNEQKFQIGDFVYPITDINDHIRYNTKYRVKDFKYKTFDVSPNVYVINPNFIDHYAYSFEGVEGYYREDAFVSEIEFHANKFNL